MKKIKNKGFMLAETLIVTTFVAGVLIFLFIQFSKLSNSYNEYYNYNTTEALYALEDVKDYIISDSVISSKIISDVNENIYLDITNCQNFSNTEYCLKLFELENIKKVIVVPNPFDVSNLNIDDNGLLNFMSKISNEGDEEYRLIAEFNNGSYATIRIKGLS